LADLKHLNESPAEIPLRYFSAVVAVMNLECLMQFFL
jgi:hypothetical protein